MEQTKKLAQTLKELQSHTELMDVLLVDDQIDIWKITFKYSGDSFVIIQFVFHLTEPLPPKATVIFPRGLEYVCFRELECGKWTKDTNIITLLLSIHSEYKSTAKKLNNKYLTNEEAQKGWEYVQRVHPEWEFKDISILMSQMSSETIQELRSQGKEMLNSNCVLTA